MPPSPTLALLDTPALVRDVLWRAGEPADPSSEFYARAIDYLNRAQLTVAAGGEEFGPEVSWPWRWHKAAHPAVVILEPAMAATVSCFHGSLYAHLLYPLPWPAGLAGRMFTHPALSAWPRVEREIAEPPPGDHPVVEWDAPWVDATGEYTGAFWKLDYTLPPDVLRVLDPIRAFQQGPSQVRCGEITGIDRLQMERAWPLRSVAMGIPNAYAVIAERTLRFNRPAHAPIRVEVDFMQVPPVLYDSPNSVPREPLEYRHVLCDIALYFLYVDKDDSRAVEAGSAASRRLQAMRRREQVIGTQIASDFGALQTRQGMGRANGYGTLGTTGGGGGSGPVGPPGPVGPASTVPGPQGIQGPPGPQGEPGEDASMVGPEGPEGPQGPPGTAGMPGATGPAGATGATGPGVAAGGTTGQLLAKASAADYDTHWASAAADGGPTSVPVPIAQGGTAATTERGARDNLLLFDNTEWLRWKTSGGTARNVLHKDGGNNLILSNVSDANIYAYPAAAFAFSVASGVGMRLDLNNMYLAGRNAANAVQNMLRITASDVLELGAAALPSIRALTAFEAASTVTLENNQKLRLKIASGTAVDVLHMSTGDSIFFGSAGRGLSFSGASYLFAVGSVILTSNNQPLQGRTVAAVGRQMLKLNASDVLELGDAATPSIQAMTALTVPSLALTGALTLNNGQPLQWKESGGTVRNVVVVDAANALLIQSPTGFSFSTYAASGSVYFSGLNLIINTGGRGLVGHDGTAQRWWINHNTTSKVLELGDAATPSIRALTAFEAASTVTLENTQPLRFKNAVGTAQNVLLLSASDTLTFGITTRPTLYNATIHNFTTGDVVATTNNKGFKGRTVAAADRYVLKLNASDVLELGDALTPSIQAMTAFAGPTNTGLLLANGMWLKGKELGGATKALIGLAADDAVYIADAGQSVAIDGVSLYVSGSVTLAVPLAPAFGGIPAGGTTGQVLKKTSATSYDVSWGTDTLLMDAMTALEARVAALEAR